MSKRDAHPAESAGGDRPKARAGSSPERHAEPDWLEQLASWASGAIVVGLAAFLVWDALKNDLPATLQASAGTPRAVGAAYQLPILVHNSGDEPAQDVQVHVELREAQGAPVEADLTIDWVAGRSRRHAIAVFSRNPARAEILVEVRGFMVP